MDSEKYLSPSQLNKYLKRKFTNDPYMRTVFLVGEITNWRTRVGNQYFAIKDDQAQIDVMMFELNFNKLSFKPKDGTKVYAKGHVSTYEPTGRIQFYVESMEQVGIGELHAQFVKLRNKLEAEGVFSLPKKPLVKFPDRIAVVTSRNAVVIHDILVTCNRRYPLCVVDLYPADVQGDGAKESIVRAMEQIENSPIHYDALIIGRGGGSLEDLWAFNEEIVVRQIVKMEMPVISSVGHETDVTLSDMVADVRAATPTAAAELATPKLTDVLNFLNQTCSSLYVAMKHLMDAKKKELAQLQSSYILTEPMRLYDQKAQLLDSLKERLVASGPQKLLEQLRSNHDFLTKSLVSNMKQELERKRAEFSQLNKQMIAYNPLKMLDRGYAYTTDLDGNTLTSVDQLKPQMHLRLYMQDGESEVEVKKIRRQEHGRKE
ncbi:MAG: exodeoxyribonuclease VII large subunit [Lactobacillus sp.]|nr:exodeoxyribonuclease VII large subunit [Lactobacillus sp.]